MATDGPLGDAEEQDRARSRVARARRQARKDLAAVMETPEGRRVMWRLLNRANLFGDDYAQDSRDHARLAGYRAFGVELLEELQTAAPANSVHMVTEQWATSAKAKALKAIKDE